jgi:hypothetical protein
MPDKGRTLGDPIPLPDGGELRTLRGAGNYIAGLPKRQHETFAWRAAIEALVLVAEQAATLCCRGSGSCGRCTRMSRCLRRAGRRR